MRRSFRMFSVVSWCLLALAASALAQTPNPVPFVNQPLVPTAVAPGGPDFTLTVNGTGFVPKSVVNWNGSPRPTAFINNSQLTAAIPATDIANWGTASITVVSPPPGGGASNIVFLPLTVSYTQPHVRTSWANDRVYSVAVADFNADGAQDLATGVWADVTVKVYLGDGAGLFRPPTILAAPSLVRSIVSADFNGDGRPDLAFACGAVLVALGNGDGTFQTPIDLSAGSQSVSLVAGDFNRDGKVDLAVVNDSGSSVSVFLGNGDGTFASGAGYGAAWYPSAATVGDFNGDGKLDLAVAAAGEVDLFLGNGEGTFQAPVATRFSDHGDMIAAADFNGDGKLDLVVAGGNASTSPAIWMFLGSGDGTFTANVVLHSNAQPEQRGRVALSDFNGDAKLDLAWRNDYFGFNVSLGNGDGTFQSPSIPFYLGGARDDVYGLAVADFNNDGRLDLTTGQSVLLQFSPVDLHPTSLAFGDQIVGTTSTRQGVTLANYGAGPLTITSIEISGANAGDFDETNDCPIAPATLAVETACLLSVSVFPTATGPRSAEITVSDDAPGSAQQVVTLTANGINPSASLSPTNLDFGNQTLNTASSSQTVTLTNSGVGPLMITSVSASDDFAQTNTCGASVAEGAQCTISVTFRPTASGARTGMITITDNAADSPQTITLTGTGIPATITLSTTSLSFGDQDIGTTSASQPVTVTNSGSGPLLITSIGASGDFEQANNCPLSPSTIPSAGSCTINVTFTPTASGARSGTLTLTDNASGSPQTVTLTGTGVPPTVTVTPASLDFGDQRLSTTSAAQTVTVTNTGGGPLTISAVTASGDFARTNNCPSTVGASGSCTVSVTFKPTLRGARTGTLTVNDNGVGNPHTVSLTGNGIAPDVLLSPTALNFPDQAVGVPSPPLDVALTNSGNTTLNITSVLATPPFALSGNSCAATLAASASCTLSVTFTAPLAGTTYGALIVSDDAPGTPHTVSLTGTTAVVFPDQPVGQTSAPQAVTLTNTGSAARVISGITTTGDFAASGGCGTLASGASCAVSVTFTPTTGGARSGSLVVADNAPGSPHAMTLRGTGLGPGVSFSAATVSFGSVLVGTTSAVQTVTLTNSGNQDLSISGVSLTGPQNGDYTLANGCGATLAATASCTASVTFTPTATGARTASLVVADNAPGNPHTVALTGTGTDFALGTQAGGSTSATVAAGVTATYNLRLAPTGFSGTVALACAWQGSTPLGARCSVSPNSVTLNGTDPAPFAVNVTTTARAMAAPQYGDYKSPLQPIVLGLMLLMLAAVVLAPRFRGDDSPRRDVPAERLRRRPVGPSLLAATLLFVLLWAACGGGGWSVPPPPPYTHAGTYDLTLTATASGVSKTTTLTLTVN